jgi:GMC oxidoreductase/gluconate 2-dehydrogenase subunit 3-like protein
MPEGITSVHQRIVAALGPVFVPSRSGDPGYKELEAYGITDYVMQQRPDEDAGDLRFGIAGGGNDWLKPESLERFNAGAQALFGGKGFVDLDEKQREEYIAAVIDGSRIADKAQRDQLQSFYRNARRRILRVFYSNYPEHQVKRDAHGLPILKPGDTHQETNPNTNKMVTGWDIAGYRPTASWEEEERMRERAKKILPYWFEGDVVRLHPNRPPAAAAIKNGDGHDYYDVIVLGGGTAGCMIAGRLAERGINPKTGDRLRVAMIEGGDDWTIHDPGVRPGYGYPVRRRMITKIADGIGPDGGGGPDYVWPAVGYDENFKILGGCSIHFGGTLWLPGDEDFDFYRQTTGVNWDFAKFGDAIQEVRDLYHVMNPPDAWWTNGDHVWADGARALGFDVRVPEIAYRNPIGDDGDCSRYDTKGTSLPWAYIGLNNGLKVIANADIQKIVIEKPAGGRAVATGAVYKDKAGAMHEVRAARVVVALGTGFTPGLLYRSGYGPREFLGDKLRVENANVGHHLTGDADLISTAYMAEEVTPKGQTGPVADPWVATTPRPWGELTWQVRGGAPGEGTPMGTAVGIYAPEYGWEHKEYMRDGAGARRMLIWRNHVGAIPAQWRVRPDRKLEQYQVDVPRINASIKHMEEIVREWQKKLSMKVVKTDFRAFTRNAQTIEPFHRTGTARAGESRENSVCSSDFDCHDIDHLLFTSGAVIPKTFFWSCGPIAVNAAYAWRRMIANHFSKGCSTKGFA